MKKAKRTPGEWKKKGPSVDRMTTGRLHHHAGDFAILDSEGDIIAEVYARVSTDKVVDAEANAAFIVQACNSFDGLVGALRELTEAITSNGVSTKAMVSACAALARAGEK